MKSSSATLALTKSFFSCFNLSPICCFNEGVMNFCIWWSLLLNHCCPDPQPSLVSLGPSFCLFLRSKFTSGGPALAGSPPPSAGGRVFRGPKSTRSCCLPETIGRQSRSGGRVLSFFSPKQCTPKMEETCSQHVTYDTLSKRGSAIIRLRRVGWNDYLSAQGPHCTAIVWSVSTHK